MSLLALQDLFRRYRDRSTGVWKLGQEPSRTIYFDYGDTVFASSTHLQDRLTTILVERGRVTQAQMDYALTNLKPGISIGKNLIEMGFITQRDLLDVAKIQVERIILGAMGQPDVMPVFETRELDANVVRLPLSTPQLLLAGILGIQDREWLLELLGPLNQVVVLQGRSLQDLSLPPDLAKLSPLLDGTHTLLELSREAAAEPMRVGAFALFLREMGWARLHEMPPLDRQALDLALTPEPEPLSAPLPDPPLDPTPQPSLFESIQEAARPTTNLEHLSLALDEEVPPAPPGLAGLDALPDLEEAGPEPSPEPPSAPAPEPLYLPDEVQVPGFQDAEPTIRVESGHAQVPTPSVELPPLPEDALELTAPPVTLAAPPDPTAEPDREPAGETPAPPEEPEAPRSGARLYALVGIGLAVLLLVGAFWVRRRRHPAPKPLPGAPVQPAPEVKGPAGPTIAVPPAQETPAQEAPAGEPAAAEASPASEAPKAKEAPKGEEAPKAKEAPRGKEAPKAKEEPKGKGAAPETGKAATVAERLEALRRGDLGKAVAQGQQRVKGTPGGHWALRLEIACQGDTIRHVADLFKDGKPDLFLMPMTLRDGRACYQVLYGDFPSREAAEKEIRRLPPTFSADKNRPKAFKYAEIPAKQ